MTNTSQYKHLPTTLKELKQRNWQQLDVILISGDAYVDHPSFGIAVIGRVLENIGLKVAILPQPNWQDDLRDFKKLGKPRLFFGISSGNMDSMVNHYTANKRLRSNDAYTPNGESGFRPDYATTVYSKIIRKLFPETAIVLGGVEASLRRFTHYDYWSNQLKPGILFDSQADILVYGMGEQAIVDIAKQMIAGKKINELKDIPQTAFIDKTGKYENNKDIIHLNSHEICLKDKRKFAHNFKFIEQESNKMRASIIVQKLANSSIIVNPPYYNLNEEQIDEVYKLNFTRLPHPKYHKRGKIPAFEMIKFSVNAHRGCFGGCSFCTISAHQGKFIQSRSEKSVIEEIKQISRMPDFKGYISDIGGPSANMYKMQGINLKACLSCTRPSCIHPSICSNLNTNHDTLTKLYKSATAVKGIKKIFIGSGIRYDMFFDKNKQIKNDKKVYAENLIRNHVSGRLKIAPEHTSDKVLMQMRKPSFDLFKKFDDFFKQVTKKFALKYQLIPYFISSHPASKDEDMAELAVNTKALDFKLEQVQDFTPTPMTLATVIYYSGFDPYTMKRVYTAKDKQSKLNQRMFFFWYKNENRFKIEKKLQKIGRSDLISKFFNRKNKH